MSVELTVREMWVQLNTFKSQNLVLLPSGQASRALLLMVNERRKKEDRVMSSHLICFQIVDANKSSKGNLS